MKALVSCRKRLLCLPEEDINILDEAVSFTILLWGQNVIIMIYDNLRSVFSSTFFVVLFFLSSTDFFPKNLKFLYLEI